MRNLSHLAFQAQGRALVATEIAFAATLEGIFRDGVHEFDQVVARLNVANALAPNGAQVKWTEDLLESELRHLNTELDAAYAANGYGA